MNVSKIIGISIGLFVAAAILPTAILTLGNTSTAAGAPWADASATTLTLVGVIGIVAVAGLVYWIYKEFVS